MADTAVWTFFYGSYINFEVLKEVDLAPEHFAIARLNGYDIRIQPLANLVPSDQHCVYGITATATHAELDRLYTHAQDVLGSIFLPEAVIIQTQRGSLRPVLCYIGHEMDPAPATNDYIDGIVNPAHAYGFPKWYID
jgi:hypothetical protein